MSVSPPTLHRNRNLSEEGLSLVEVLISVFFITPVLLLLTNVFLQNVRGVTESWDETKAISSAQRLMDQIRSMKWDELTVYGSTIATPSATINREEGSGDPWDDIDDWHGFNVPDPIYAGYGRLVTVEFVDVDLLTGAVSTSTSLPTDFKRVTARITNPSGRPFP